MYNFFTVSRRASETQAREEEYKKKTRRISREIKGASGLREVMLEEAAAAAPDASGHSTRIDQ